MSKLRTPEIFRNFDQSFTATMSIQATQYPNSGSGVNPFVVGVTNKNDILGLPLATSVLYASPGISDVQVNMNTSEQTRIASKVSGKWKDGCDPCS